MRQIEEKRKNIEEWLLQIGKLIKDRMSHVMTIEEKTSLADVVTNVDKEVEQLFQEKIKHDYPEANVLGEESYDKTRTYALEGDVWIIDPIDGTLNFVKEHQNFAVMIAYYQDGIGQLGFIYDVMANDLYVAQAGYGVFKNDVHLKQVDDTTLNRSILNVSANIFFMQPVPFENELKAALSIRILGSAAMSFIRLINGAHQGYVCVYLNPWDYMAGLIFVKELGLVATTFDNTPVNLLQTTTLLVATPSTHQEILG